MRVLEGSNLVRNGLVGIIVVILVTGVGQSFTSVPMLFAQPNYYAQFKDAAGLKPGDLVRIAGVTVGKVRSLDIEGDKILVGFNLGNKQIGAESRAAIRTDTILGRKDMEIEPRGSQPLKSDGVLPLGQTTTPYQIYDAFFDVTKAASHWDIDTVKQSLNVLSETIDQTYPHLSAALDGIKRFSDTIGKRDEQIRQLLANANKIATILGDRSTQINRLLVNAQALLAAINERGQAITYLLQRVDTFSAQVSGFINDNPNLNHVLEQLHTISDVLAQRKFDLADVLSTVAKFVASLGEAIASGPYFKVELVNLLPYQLLQPFVDAAFKKRGIDPENFWRGAGLPAFQWPEPNGTRLPNGAPPPAPTPLEGTPEHPGPAVPPGSPCSYTPPADGLPRPDNPLPCAQLSQGPFGGNPFAAGANYGPPDVATSAPNPDGLPPTPGMPIAGLPGVTPPDVPGTPVPLPPNAPPGARTEPLGPAAGPYPPPAYPPAPLPGPPPPAGPGPQLAPAGTPPLPGNPPYLPPGAQEGNG
jgi:phospholipid/cholesterol/gamma-HCH transport system substrate-binding protein